MTTSKIQVGMEFILKDSGGLGRVRRVNQFGAVYFQTLYKGKWTFNSSEMCFAPNDNVPNLCKIIKEWL